MSYKSILWLKVLRIIELPRDICKFATTTIVLVEAQLVTIIPSTMPTLLVELHPNQSIPSHQNQDQNLLSESTLPILRLHQLLHFPQNAIAAYLPRPNSLPEGSEWLLPPKKKTLA